MTCRIGESVSLGRNRTEGCNNGSLTGKYKNLAYLNAAECPKVCGK